MRCSLVRRCRHDARADRQHPCEWKCRGDVAETHGGEAGEREIVELCEYWHRLQHDGVALVAMGGEQQWFKAAGLNRFNTDHHQPCGETEQQITGGGPHHDAVVDVMFPGQLPHQPHHAPADQHTPAQHQLDPARLPVNRREQPQQVRPPARGSPGIDTACPEG